MCSLDEQDEIKELVVKWLLESSYVMRAVEGTLAARGHIVRRCDYLHGGYGTDTVRMEVQLKQGTGVDEARMLIDFVERMTGKRASFSTEMNDHGHGFAREPNRLSFEMVIPSRKSNAGTTRLTRHYWV